MVKIKFFNKSKNHTEIDAHFMHLRTILFTIVFLSMLALPVLWPRLDPWMSGYFYSAGRGFYLADNPVLLTLHGLAYWGARALGIGFILFATLTYVRHRTIFSLDTKAWLFLLVALLVAPGLVANAGFKDQWGRARPREVTEFGGASPFTPALIPQFQRAHSNGSFVSGDGAFGFFLPAFAYVVPRRYSRRVFWGAMGTGVVFGFVRIAMGAHFFSDVIYAAFLMLMVIAGLHALFYGRQSTALLWRSWFSATI